MIVMKENEESCQLLFPSQIGLKSVAYIGERAATLRPSSALLAQWQVVPLRKNLCCIQDGGHHELVGHTVTDHYDDGSHSCRTWITMAVFRQIELSSLLCALGCRVWSWVRGGGGGGAVGRRVYRLANGVFTAFCKLGHLCRTCSAVWFSSVMMYFVQGVSSLCCILARGD